MNASGTHRRPRSTAARPTPDDPSEFERLLRALQHCLTAALSSWHNYLFYNDLAKPHFPYFFRCYKLLHFVASPPAPTPHSIGQNTGQSVYSVYVRIAARHCQQKSAAIFSISPLNRSSAERKCGLWCRVCFSTPLRAIVVLKHTLHFCAFAVLCILTT